MTHRLRSKQRPSRDSGFTLIEVLVVVLIKLGLLLGYVRRFHGLGRPWFTRATLSEQFRHAAPFGISNDAVRYQ